MLDLSNEMIVIRMININFPRHQNHKYPIVMGMQK